MNENEIRKAHYRLAARLCGEKLVMEPILCDELRAEHLRTIDTIGVRKRNMDERALAQSVEWERLGDFMIRCGRMLDAVRAYREAVLCCLDGEYYDHGRDHFPSRWLRMRFFDLHGKTEVWCAGDAHLRSLICEDPFIRQEYIRFRAYYQS